MGGEAVPHQAAVLHRRRRAGHSVDGHLELRLECGSGPHHAVRDLGTAGGLLLRWHDQDQGAAGDDGPCAAGVPATQGAPGLHPAQFRSLGLLLHRRHRRDLRGRPDQVQRRRVRSGLPGRRLSELPALRRRPDRHPRPQRLLLAQGRCELRVGLHHHEGAPADPSPGGEPRAAESGAGGPGPGSDRPAERAVRHHHPARRRQVPLDPPVPAAQGQERGRPAPRPDGARGRERGIDADDQGDHHARPVGGRADAARLLHRRLWRRAAEPSRGLSAPGRTTRRGRTENTMALMMKRQAQLGSQDVAPEAEDQVPDAGVEAVDELSLEQSARARAKAARKAETKEAKKARGSLLRRKEKDQGADAEGTAAPEPGEAVDEPAGDEEEQAPKKNWFQRRKEMVQLAGDFESYPHLLALKPREKYIFRSDYYEVDDSVGCVLAFFHDDAAHDNFAAFWGIDRIPDGLDDSVTAVVLEQVKRMDDKWVDQYTKQSEKLDRLDANEQEESGSTSSRRKAAKISSDLEVTIGEIQDGATYLSVHNRLLLKAPTLEILED